MNLPAQSFAPEMSLAITASLSAGQQVMRVYNTRFSHAVKDDKEPVTEADIKSNKIIQEILSASGYLILSEESADNLARLKARRVWIIDPLDGTSDFVNRTGEFSIMIALIEDGAPKLGVVYNPVKDIICIAERGNGAYKRNNNKWQKMRASETQDLRQARAVVSRHHLSEKEEAFLKTLGIPEFVKMGSSGLKIIEVASGEAELYFSMADKMKQWDTAAAFCIIKEAGGEITDMLGNELVYNTENIYHQNGILATNNLLHDDVLDYL